MPKIGAGEAWKKVFGPVFIYLNSTYDSSDALQLWEDGKSQVFSFNSSFSLKIVRRGKESWISKKYYLIVY